MRKNIVACIFFDILKTLFVDASTYSRVKPQTYKGEAVYAKSYWDMLSTSMESDFLSMLYTILESDTKHPSRESETLPEPEENLPLRSNKVTILTILFVKDHDSTSGAEIDEYLLAFGEDDSRVNLETRIFLTRAGILIRKKGYLWTLTKKGQLLCESQFLTPSPGL